MARVGLGARAYTVAERLARRAYRRRAAWHRSLAAHATGFDPVHTPDWQESLCVHALPSLHVVPFGANGFEHAPSSDCTPA